MDAGRRRSGSSAGCIVLIAALAVAAFFGLLIISFVTLGDSFAEAAVTNKCGKPLLGSWDSASGYTAKSGYDFDFEAGGTISTMASSDFAVRLFGGPWKLVHVSGAKAQVIEGANCPSEGTPNDPAIVAARAPMLGDAEIVSASVERSSGADGVAPWTEITTIVARVSPSQAAAWDEEFAMAPTAPQSELLALGIDSDATWLASGAFDSVVAADDLGASAYVDPETGTVVVRIWEWNLAS